MSINDNIPPNPHPVKPPPNMPPPKQVSQPKRYRPVSMSKDRVEMHQCASGEWTSLTEFYTLHDRLAAIAAENEVLRNKVEWLRKAEHLVIWDGERWKVRPEHGGKPL